MKPPLLRLLKSRRLLLALSLCGTLPLYSQEIPASPEPVPAESAAPGEAVGTDVAAGGAEAAAGEASEGEEAAGDVDAVAKAAADSLLELDIRSSSLAELASWCRSLGLSEGGAKEELASRLRSHFGLPRPDGDAEEGENNNIIIIEAARSTEYFTLDVVDEEYARLRGDVVVSLKNDDAVHRISAWEILYNRTRNVLTASGGVVYIKEQGDTRETFRGESVTVNLDDWSTVFLDGVSERSLDSDATTYRFAGTIITRDDDEVTIMTRAEISNASDENALWSLSASKLWLLPGSDWAVIDAILRVGNIPVLYIPGFFFPADEMVFHPVFGYRSREGNFAQTTTYIFGRPEVETDSESSISRILGSSADNEKVREGLFLRNTGRKSRDPNDTRFALLVDGYTNLGTYLGTELALPARGVLGALDLSLGLGVTRTIYLLDSNYYTPFAESDGISDWNSAYLFGAPVPFRYRFDTTGSVAGTQGALSWAFPYYADPYVDRDFMDRSEQMDWIGLLKNSGDSTQTAEAAAENILGPYEWRLTGSLTPNMDFFSPYINTLSVSSMSSTVAFRTRNSTIRKDTVSPDRIFFYPDKFTIASISAAIAGTPFSLGAPAARSAETQAETETGDAAKEEDPFAHIGVPRPPWEDAFGGDDALDAADPYQLKPPALGQIFTFSPWSGPRFAIDYRFAPTMASELQFRSSQQNWPEFSEVNWEEVSSILSTLRSDGSITFGLTNPSTELYALSLRFFGNVAWQDYTMINEEAEEFDTQEELDAAYLRVHNATFYTTSSELINTIKPVYWDPIWGNSNFQYTLRGLLVKSAFNQTTEEPTWDAVFGKWDEESLDAHSLAFNLIASVMDKVQNFSVVASIPPEETSLSGDLTLRAWISETNVKEKILDPYEEPIFDPLYFTETLRFTTDYSAQQYLVYDPELEELTNLTPSLTLGGFTASYSAVRSRSYYLSPGLGWLLTEDPEKLNPRELRLAYIRTFTKEKIWHRLLSFKVNVNTGFTFDLQRYTYSRFNFSLGFTLGLTKFIDLSLTTSSENAVMFRYFQDMPFFSLPEALPGQTNIFVDLLNSFRFDNDSLRRQSGFKLKSFNLSMTHHMGDWDATLGLTLSPYLDQAKFPYQYKFNNQVSFVVQWLPIPEIKSSIHYDKDEFVRKD
jgi:hypothetical protein